MNLATRTDVLFCVVMAISVIALIAWLPPMFLYPNAAWVGWGIKITESITLYGGVAFILFLRARECQQVVRAGAKDLRWLTGILFYGVATMLVMGILNALDPWLTAH